MRTRQPSLTRPDRQRGVALLTVMFIVVLGTIAAVAMTERQHIDTRLTTNLLHGDQAQLYALAGEDWAKVILARDLSDDARSVLVDHLEEDWATRLPPTLVEGGQVDGYIEDLQARFNLNNLYQASTLAARNQPLDAAQAAFLERLLRTLNINIELADGLGDWIDPDVEVRYPYGAEDPEYLSQEPPYRAANRALVDTTELLLIRDVTPEMLTALRPYVTTLPGATRINVNTASPVVLMALAEPIDEYVANGIIERRQEEAFTGFNEFLGYLGEAGITRDRLPEGFEQLIGFSSSYFLVHTDIEVGRARLQLDSYLLRDITGDIRVLKRSRRAI